MLTSNLCRRRLIQYFCTRQLHHVVSTEIIKPSLPNPCLKRYNLSLMDQFCPWVYIPFIFHYPNNTAIQDTVVERSRRLKDSLSETLTQYYPFAGRLNTVGSYVDCDDKGVEFQEVTIEFQLSEFMQNSEHEVRDLLYPKHDFTCKHDSALLLVRLYHFQCGGVSILVCMSHKLGDAASFLTFMKSWAKNTFKICNNSTLNEKLVIVPPHFISQPNINTDIRAATEATSEVKWITRKFMFPNSEIAKLKAEIDESYASATTRVEILASFLFKRAIVTASSSGDSFPIALVLPANMRSKMIPPLPETSIGNFLRSITAVIRNSNENNLNIIVEKIKKAKVGLEDLKKGEHLVNISDLQEFKSMNCKYFTCSSLCMMQFYEINFGWGNPCKVTLADNMVNNGFKLMDTPNGDGIEAIVSLDEHDMIVFQDDQEFLAYSRS